MMLSVLGTEVSKAVGLVNMVNQAAHLESGLLE